MHYIQPLRNENKKIHWLESDTLFVVGNQAVISRKDVRLKIDCRIINQCSRADVSGRAIFHHKLTNSIFLILPVITFRTINVDVAAAKEPSR